MPAKWKQSEDPAQDFLREKKAHWNDFVSRFIDNFLEFKKLYNGRPSKFNSKRLGLSDGPNPLVKEIFGKLEASFDELAHEASNIIELQEKYSETRAKKKVKVAQESQFKDLIAFKGEFNAVSREFTKYLINFKRLINGIPGALFEQKSFITSAIPSNPETHLNNLRSMFDQLSKRLSQTVAIHENMVKQQSVKEKVERFVKMN